MIVSILIFILFFKKIFPYINHEGIFIFYIMLDMRSLVEPHFDKEFLSTISTRLTFQYFSFFSFYFKILAFFTRFQHWHWHWNLLLSNDMIYHIKCCWSMTVLKMWPIKWAPSQLSYRFFELILFSCSKGGRKAKRPIALTLMDLFQWTWKSYKWKIVPNIWIIRGFRHPVGSPRGQRGRNKLHKTRFDYLVFIKFNLFSSIKRNKNGGINTIRILN